jgi:hypothetical protein
MKRYAVLLSAVALLACFCGKGEPALKLEPLEWVEETSHYVVTVEGEVAGTSFTTVIPRTHEDKPILEIASMTEVGSESGSTRDSSWLVVRQEDLKPVHAFRTVETEGGNLWSETSYSDEEAGVQAMTPVGAKSIDLPLETRTFDNDEVTTLLRVLRLEEQEDVEMEVVVGLAGAVIPVTLTLMGDEVITVPAGVLETRRIQMGIAGQFVDLWYEQAGRRRLVRYEAPGSELVMELTEKAVPDEAGQPSELGTKPPRTGR